MFTSGQIVTLAIDKTHGDNPEHAMSIRSGICGMIMSRERHEGGNHLYVIDFGPEGQWHCYHEELRGDDPAGWDEEEDRPEPLPSDEDGLALGAEPAETHDEGIAVPEDTTVPDEPPQAKDRIDPEADIRRREKELEKGIKIK